MGCQTKYGAVNVFTHPHEIDEAGTLVAQKNPFLLRPLNLLLNLEQFLVIKWFLYLWLFSCWTWLSSFAKDDVISFSASVRTEWNLSKHLMTVVACLLMLPALSITCNQITQPSRVKSEKFGNVKVSNRNRQPVTLISTSTVKLKSLIRHRENIQTAYRNVAGNQEVQKENLWLWDTNQSSRPLLRFKVGHLQPEIGKLSLI